MVGSLSGTMEEVYVAKEVIRKWNQENAERAGKLFMPVECQEADMMIGIVGNRVEKTATVQQMVEAGNKVMLFFNAFQDPKNTIPTEREEVMAFKEKMKGKCPCAEYNGGLEMGKILAERLSSL